MAKSPADQKPVKQAQIREDRLKAALKANMGRRKAQARARKTQDETAPDTGNGPDGSEQESR
ncbi:hypothetical protein JQT66_13075 [Sulfitobacter mediterraneus]|uniref:hypothetical protein n=1 Tax=Sulfitobacter mediterraneus TaxID=83219 RepID=UPI001932E19D|nr:hypothetical protein [Sulfitobacter mediterraneus]MBM1311172.1 hypothetical protein [Sulfitobacter mediterraneus]MBM1315054.1 hypothetical protein [Sulfitobacter mediterraneus]MBM1323415.1 hypothetical protein [Sulfitobacter mediterraneus]MBM1327327.1 hypothetical protein [Sulfitobacter mediterraneus]MBM1398675.1 hypothetical protein [Sulfitobacter mediterraneus]